MGAITWGQLKKERPRIITFRDKINHSEPFELTTGVKVVLEINTTDPRKDYQGWFNSIATGTDSPPTGDPLIDPKTNTTYSLGKLQKTSEFGGAGFNVGNTGEGIFAAAIAARFLSKTKTIIAGDVEKIIKELRAAGARKAAGSRTSVVARIKKESDNLEPLVKDVLNVEVELSKNDMNHFFNDLDKYAGYVRSAVGYANGSKVKRWADMLYRNNTENTINVKSLGISSATVTKVDTWVEIGTPDIHPPRRVNINISLKMGDVKQIGQVGGIAFEGQQRMWKSFGITIPKSLKDDFIKFVAQKEYAKAFDVTFEHAQRETLPNIPKADPKNPGNGFDAGEIGKGIVYHATLNERNIEIAQVTESQGTTVYKFRNAVNIIGRQELRSELVTSTRGGLPLPTLKFKEKNGSGRLLVQIRARKSGTTTGGAPYFRTVVEKGPFLSELIAERIKLPLENQQ